jgi:hypothetical protein
MNNSKIWSILSTNKLLLNQSDLDLEERKNEISHCLKRCISRHNAVCMLFENFATSDALILLRQLTLDLINVACLIYEKEGLSNLADAKDILNALPDKRISELGREIISQLILWEKHPEGSRNLQLYNKSEKTISKMLHALKKAYTEAKRAKMITPLNNYKARLKKRIILTILIGSGLFLLAIYATCINPYVQTWRNLNKIAKVAYQAKKTRDLPLFEITGSMCSDCVCRGVRDLRQLPENHPCVKRWDVSIRNIYKVATGEPKISPNLLRDAWKSPYLLDENENERDKRDKRHDVLRSAGSDGVYDTADDITVKIKNALK